MDANNFDFDTKIRNKSFQTLTSLKKGLIDVAFNERQPIDKITYMKTLIDRIFELMGKDPIEGIALKIVK